MLVFVLKGVAFVFLVPVIVTLLYAFVARYLWVHRQKYQMYWSGHFTPNHERERKKWLDKLGFKEEEMDIKASVPPFNVKTSGPPPCVEELNLPAFGPNISRVVMKIFEPEDVKKVARELNVPITKVELSSFVQKKMSKVHKMIVHAREDPLISTNADAIDRMEKFVKEFEGLGPDSIRSAEDWSDFMHKHVERGWENRIDFRLLLDNFKFHKDAADALRKKEIFDDDGDKQTLEHYGCRWLSKAFTGYAPKGALVDVVNLAFAMSGKPVPKKLIDKEIASEIDTVRQKIAENRMFELWIPSKLVMDAEVDDNLCWIWLESIHRALGTKLEVLVQLPHDEELSNVEGGGCTLLSNVAASMRERDGCTVWIDEHSRNAKAVKDAYGGDWTRSFDVQGSAPAQPGTIGDSLLDKKGKGSGRDGFRVYFGAWLLQLKESRVDFIGQNGGWYDGRQWPLIVTALVDKRVLKLQHAKEREDGKAGHSSCLGPVVAWVVWGPVGHALLAVVFWFLGASSIHLHGASPNLPTWWFLLILSLGLVMYLGEIYIVRFSAMSYRVKAKSWKCFPVQKFENMLGHTDWVAQNGEWITFLLWFWWLSSLSMVRLYSFFQANTFLGAILFWPENDEVQCVFTTVMKHSALLPPDIDIKYVIVFILLAEILHLVFGLMFSCPRRYGHSSGENGCKHQRWDPTESRTRDWGRHLELTVAGEGFEEHSIEGPEDFTRMMDIYCNRGGVITLVRKDQTKEDFHYRGERPAYDAEYAKLIYIKNRHAYTCWRGPEMTLSTVVANIGEACNMSFIMDMLDIELDKDIVKVEAAIAKMDDVERSKNNVAFQVRDLMDSTRTALRISFSRILLYGTCFSGMQTHLQVTVFNVLRLMPLGLRTVPTSLWAGIGSQLLTLFLLGLKLKRLWKSGWQVYEIMTRYQNDIEGQVTAASMTKVKEAIQFTRRRVIILTYYTLFAASLFVLVIFWVVSKFVMETFVCTRHMWNFPLSLNPMDGCVPHPVGTCMTQNYTEVTTGTHEGDMLLI